MIHLARCCSPVPGDSIMGFITQGRGVSVHRDDCSNAVALAQRLGERIIDVEWDGSVSGQYRAVLEVMAFDRSRLLLDVSKVVAEYHLSINLEFDVDVGLEDRANGLRRGARGPDAPQ